MNDRNRDRDFDRPPQRGDRDRGFSRDRDFNYYNEERAPPQRWGGGPPPSRPMQDNYYPPPDVHPLPPPPSNRYFMTCLLLYYYYRYLCYISVILIYCYYCLDNNMKGTVFNNFSRIEFKL